MKTPLVPAEEDKRWDLVRNVLGIFEQREVRKIVSKFGIKPLDPEFQRCIDYNLDELISSVAVKKIKGCPFYFCFRYVANI